MQLINTYFAIVIAKNSVKTHTFRRKTKVRQRESNKILNSGSQNRTNTNMKNRKLKEQKKKNRKKHFYLYFVILHTSVDLLFESLYFISFPMLIYLV